MLINLEATNQNEDILFRLPYVQFKNHEVAVTELFIKWKSPVSTYGYISSTLVDKNALNPHQNVLVFCQENESYLHCKPTILQSYKIQRTELQSSEFKIHIAEKQKLTEIEKIFLQLKITDAGIQQRPEFTIQ